MKRLAAILCTLLALLALPASAQVTTNPIVTGIGVMTIGSAVSSGTATSILFLGATGTLAQDSTNFTYTTTSGPRLKVGSGGTTSAGWILGYQGASTVSALWTTGVTPSTTNYALAANTGATLINTSASGLIDFRFADSSRMALNATAGAGPSITAGIATTDVNALSVTQTWNAGGTTFTADNGNVTVTAAANGSKVIDRKANGGSLFAVAYYAASVTAAVGATVTATNLIPAKCQLIGIATRVTTQLGNSTGTTGYAVGDGSDPNRWGDVSGVAVGTSSGQADATADPSGWFGAANNVVLTAAGGNFDGTGVIRVVASCRTMSAPTS